MRLIRALRYVTRVPVARCGFLLNNVCSDSCNIWHLTRRRVTQVPNEPAVMTDGLFSGLTIKPKLIVFDLDLTLWPFDCDDFVGHKFHKKGTKVFDSNGEAVNMCPDSNYLLESIKNEDGVLLACASSSVRITFIRHHLTCYFPELSESTLSSSPISENVREVNINQTYRQVVSEFALEDQTSSETENCYLWDSDTCP
ncbi:hypothetical protein EG68_03533 [Paragonimus skrjabini miyazakii]|uniref:Magnesium-dependent phosphatase 1 n=1 Tax=Paragonimus skrjabini miyazakii TaxID=59628 RepID=A0A8S9YUY2_9TREM|nr:hypothetical protein EG68_03533 [Paragonimus skrjabini miyazakii]